jgi:hypothetical protein
VFATFILILFYKYDRVTASVWIRYPGILGEGLQLVYVRLQIILWLRNANNEQGHVVKHKVRLVAKGYVQRQGVDYEEVFAPVAQMESVRVMLAVAAHHGWIVHHMDVKSAFLNGDLAEEVFMK